jgi:hypothetical protein
LQELEAQLPQKPGKRQLVVDSIFLPSFPVAAVKVSQDTLAARRCGVHLAKKAVGPKRDNLLA